MLLALNLRNLSNVFYTLYYPRYTIVLDFTFRSMTNFELWWTFEVDPLPAKPSGKPNNRVTILVS